MQQSTHSFLNALYGSLYTGRRYFFTHVIYYITQWTPSGGAVP